jgi:hypothetical protein
VFEKWINFGFIETKCGEIINKILDEWDKKQSSQRRDLNSLFKFLKSQDLSSNYQRAIEANRSSKYVTYEDVKFLYCHPTLEISDSMRYVLTRNEFYFYKNFEMLLILGSSYQMNPSIKNEEISAMRNFTGSLYFKLLAYSKDLNKVVGEIRDFMGLNDNDKESCRFKHSIILEQLKSEPKEQAGIESYKILKLNKTRKIIMDLALILERINCIIHVDTQSDLHYY